MIGFIQIHVSSLADFREGGRLGAGKENRAGGADTQVTSALLVMFYLTYDRRTPSVHWRGGPNCV